MGENVHTFSHFTFVDTLDIYSMYFLISAFVNGALLLYL